MVIRLHMIGLGLVLVTSGLAGCVTKTASTSVPRDGAVPKRSVLNDSDRPRTASTSNSQWAAGAVGAYRESGLSDTIRKVGHSMSNALAIESQHTPATDATTLSKMPDKVDADLYLSAAAWSERRGDLETTQRQYERALRHDPANVKARVAFARFHDRNDNGDEAIQIYQEALQIAPHSTILLNDIGLCHARRGEWAESLIAFEEAVRLDPENVRYRNNLASALVETDCTEDAIEALSVIHPPSAAHYNVAYLLHIRRQDQLAHHHLQQALLQDPGMAAAHTLLQELTPVTQIAQAAPAVPQRVPPVILTVQTPVQLHAESPASDAGSNRSQSLPPDWESRTASVANTDIYSFPRRFPSVD